MLTMLPKLALMMIVKYFKVLTKARQPSTTPLRKTPMFFSITTIGNSQVDQAAQASNNPVFSGSTHSKIPSKIMSVSTRTS